MRLKWTSKLQVQKKMNGQLHKKLNGKMGTHEKRKMEVEKRGESSSVFLKTKVES